MSRSDPTTIPFSSDFGATLDLMAKEADDHSVNDHAAVCIACATCGWKDVEHDAIDPDNNQSLTKTKRISKVDRWIAFINTLSKGKKNDHCTCNAFMKCTNEYCEQSDLIGMSTTKLKIAHAENCGNQFKCRHNFDYISQRHNESVT